MKNYLIIGGTSDIGFELIKRINQKKSNIFFTYYKNKSLSRKICKDNLNIQSSRLDLRSKQNITNTICSTYIYN